MRIAFFSPQPPARSGIADYSAALLAPLSKIAEVDSFRSKPSNFDPTSYDALVYQVGNNPAHDFVYEAALKFPGVVVLHEANLHHLIADLTIGRGDWRAYWRELEKNGAPRTEHPDYRVPMLQPILECSRAAIVHSQAVERVLRAQGFTRPIARIPHGAWLVDSADTDRQTYRAKLGLSEATPLFGVFGFLKPYKRIREIQRAFKRLVKLRPDARMILVGELHPELTLNLPPEARHIDFAPMQDFNGFLAACDTILNLRYPTVEESSGTLMRAFGMGKATLVSDVGAFRELPDDVCIKIPVNVDEDELLFEYMNLFTSRPEVANALGAKAREWAQRECSWDAVAQHYLRFLTHFNTEILPTTNEYAQTHRTRLEKTIAITPPGGANDFILEMGAYLQIAPALHTQLGYGTVRGCYFGDTGKTETRQVNLPDGGSLECAIDHFDAEKDFYPYPSAHFLTVLCCELLEHLKHDPMHMMDQIHRILRPGGHVVLTTPNVASLRAISGILHGFNPMLLSSYLKDSQETRHAREYTPREIRDLLENSGFEITLLETGPFRDELRPQLAWVEHLLDKYMLPREHRGEGIYAVARKVGPVRERYPNWLYV